MAVVFYENIFCYEAASSSCRVVNLKVPINSESNGEAIVNKNTLETGHLITLNRITPSLARILQSAIKKEVLILQGEPSNYTLVYKDPTVLPSVTFKSYPICFPCKASRWRLIAV